MVPAMTACAETMLEKWRSHHGKEIEVCNEFRLLSSEVISRTAFGSSYLEGRKIFDMLSKLGLLISKNRLKIRFFGLGYVICFSDAVYVKIVSCECVCVFVCGILFNLADHLLCITRCSRTNLDPSDYLTQVILI